MKASLNGVLHMSVLDGWWIDGYNGMNGWAFGDTAPGQDRGDAEQLYNMLESEVVPMYYTLSQKRDPAYVGEKNERNNTKHRTPIFRQQDG